MEELLARFSVKQKIMVLVSVVFVATMLVLGIVLDRIITNHEMENFVEETDLQATQVDTSMDLFLRGLVPLVGYPSTVVYYERGKRFAGESKYPLRKMLSFAWEGVSSLTVSPSSNSAAPQSSQLTR